MARKRFLVSALFLGVLLFGACGEKDTAPAADGDSEVQEREGEAAEPGDSEPDKDLDSDSDSDSALDSDSDSDDDPDPDIDQDSDSDKDVECDALEACCSVECQDNAIYSDCSSSVDENGCYFPVWTRTPCEGGTVCTVSETMTAYCAPPCVERCEGTIAVHCMDIPPFSEYRENCQDEGGGCEPSDYLPGTVICLKADGDAEREGEWEVESESEAEADTEAPQMRVLYGPNGLPRSVIKCY